MTAASDTSTGDSRVPVKLYVYDLSGGMARLYSQALLGVPIEGVWHSGVVVHGKEVYFGQGIKVSEAGQTHLGPPHKIIDLGHTEVPWELVQDYVEDMQDEYGAHTYHLLDHNCNDFSNDLSKFLTGNEIPADVKDVARLVSGTPLGQMLAQNMSGTYGLR